MQIRSTRRPSRSRRRRARGHEGPDVLYLHAGPPLENEGGSRARVLVPWDGGVGARVVLGGAGEDFGRGGEENNLGEKAFEERWARWYTCSLCEQDYHGVVRCALGWACWKTYVGRPEGNQVGLGDVQLGNGLSAVAKRHADALSVQEAELSTLRRIGASEGSAILAVQGNIANTYRALGRFEEALSLRRDVYFGL